MSIRLEHEFTVPVGVEQAWEALLDPERVAPCMPGATLDSVVGDEFTGKVKVKVGPITVTYRGQGRFAEKDADNRTLLIEASGTQARGSGTARGTVLARLHAADGATRVAVETELSVTGKVAQFGRGMLADVSDRLVARFAAALADELSGGSRPAAADPELAAVADAEATEDADGGGNGGEAFDLVRDAGVPAAKRVLPYAVVFGVLALCVRWLLRRRNRL